MRKIIPLLILLAAAGCSHKKTPVAKAPIAPAPATPAAARTTQTNNPPQTAVNRASVQASSGSNLTADRKAMDDAANRLNRLLDAMFDYDKYNLRTDAVSALTGDVDIIKAVLNRQPGLSLKVEGYCDERGSLEYNLGLGEKRADNAKQFLVQLGLPAARMETISYGKEKQVCSESNESCWQRNRRAHLVALQR